MFIRKDLPVLFLLPLVVLSLASCASDRWEVGIDSISPDGRWATIVEQPVNSSSATLVLIDLHAQSIAEALANDVSSYPQTQFSFDSRYLVYRNQARDWVLQDIQDAEALETIFAESEDEITFLPGKNALVIFSPDENTSLFRASLISDLQNPDEKRALTNIGGRLLKYRFNSTPISSDDSCPSQSGYMNVVIDPEGVVFALGVEGDDTVTPLSPGISRRITDLIQSQIDEVYSLFDGDEYLTSWVQILHPDSTSEEIDIRVESLRAIENHEDRIRSLFAIDISESTPEELDSWGQTVIDGMARFSTTLSPDGTKLLFLRTEIPDSKDAGLTFEFLFTPTFGTSTHTLFLIDLVVGGEPLRLTQFTGPMPYATFSPDGSHILYETQVGEERLLYLAETEAPLDSAKVVARGEFESPCWY